MGDVWKWLGAVAVGAATLALVFWYDVSRDRARLTALVEVIATEALASAERGLDAGATAISEVRHRARTGCSDEVTFAFRGYMQRHQIQFLGIADGDGLVACTTFGMTPAGDMRLPATALGESFAIAGPAVTPVFPRPSVLLVHAARADLHVVAALEPSALLPETGGRAGIPHLVEVKQAEAAAPAVLARAPEADVGPLGPVHGDGEVALAAVRTSSAFPIEVAVSLAPAQAGHSLVLTLFGGIAAAMVTVGAYLLLVDRFWRDRRQPRD